MQSSEAASALLDPVSAEVPCGRDLDSSLELYALEEAARAPDEPSIGGVSAVDSRNWREVATRAQALLKVSKDLRVAAYLTRAQLNVSGLAGFVSGVAVMRGLIERFWDGLYPALDPDDRDPMQRITALSELWSPELLAALRGTVVVNSRELGSFSLNDVLVARNAPEARSGSSKASPAHVLKALEFADPAALRAVYTSVCAAVDDLSALTSIVRGHVGSSYRVQPTALIGAPEDRNGSRAHTGLLGRLAQILEGYVAPAHPERAGVDDVELSESTGLASATGDNRSVPSEREVGNQPMRSMAEIRSREDVIRALDAICSYYERHEPSSPIPILMQRARGLVTMNFLDIVRSLASKGVSQIELLAGLDKDSESD